MKCFLFDIDGVLADSSQAHIKSLQLMFNDVNFEYTIEHENMLGSLCTSDKIDKIDKLYDLKLDAHVKKLMHKKKFEYLNLDDVRIGDNIPEVFSFLKENDIAYGIVTNARNEYADFILRKIGAINPCCVATNSLGLKTKPAPDLYLYAMEKMNKPKNSIVVFEDSEEGISAAKAAGLDVHAVSTADYLNSEIIKNIFGD